VANEADSPFTIPESSYAAIRQLVDLKADDFEALVAGLSSGKPSKYSKPLARHISKKIPTVAEPVIHSIVEEIMTLEFLKQDFEMAAEPFASALAIAAREIVSENFRYSEQDAETLKSRLTKIFKADRVLELNAKASAVIADHDKLFINAKILTDARPVFDDSGSKIEAVAIVHTLRIHFEHNQKHEDIYVSLDHEDMAKLKAAIDRANRKASALRKVMQATNVPDLDEGQPNGN